MGCCWWPTGSPAPASPKKPCSGPRRRAGAAGRSGRGVRGVGAGMVDRRRVADEGHAAAAQPGGMGLQERFDSGLERERSWLGDRFRQLAARPASWVSRACMRGRRRTRGADGGVPARYACRAARNRGSAPGHRRAAGAVRRSSRRAHRRWRRRPCFPGPGRARRSARTPRAWPDSPHNGVVGARHDAFGLLQFQQLGLQAAVALALVEIAQADVGGEPSKRPVDRDAQETAGLRHAGGGN